MKDVKLTNNDGNNINKVEVQAKAATVVLQRNGQQKDMEAQTKGKTKRNDTKRSSKTKNSYESATTATGRYDQTTKKSSNFIPVPVPNPHGPHPNPCTPSKLQRKYCLRIPNLRV